MRTENGSIPGFEELKLRDFTNKYGEYLDEICEDWADVKMPNVCRGLFKTTVFTAMTHQMNTQFATGIVITGYGELDLYPKLYEITVDGGFLDRVRCYELESCDIATHPEGAAISTFAQDETVQALLKGYDNRFAIFQFGLFKHTMELLVDEILTEHSGLPPDERSVAAAMITRRINEAVKDLNREIAEFSEEEFRTPVLEVLRTAPKETLAELAESLVSITSLRQRVSGDLETVGGPVDVALISKGDGFVWMKRKHYFDKALNPHYFQNYFREVEHGPARET